MPPKFESGLADVLKSIITQEFIFFYDFFMIIKRKKKEGYSALSEVE